MPWNRLKTVLISMGPIPADSPITDDPQDLFQYAYEETRESLDEEEPPRPLLTTFTAIHLSQSSLYIFVPSLNLYILSFLDLEFVSYTVNHVFFPFH